MRATAYKRPNLGSTHAVVASPSQASREKGGHHGHSPWRVSTIWSCYEDTTYRTSALVVTVTACFDRAYYRTWTFPPWRFLYFNMVRSLAVFYGRNVWHYYLTQAFPLLLMTVLPLGLVGFWRTLAGSRKSSGTATSALFPLALAVVLTTTALSFIPHKEVRFLCPLLPVLHLFAAEGSMVVFFPVRTPSASSDGTRDKRRLSRKFCILSGLLVHFAIAWYVSLVHQSGVISVMDYLRHEYENQNPVTDRPSSSISVGFLMPCHSTPWRSHLVHSDIRAWALTCEPPLNVPISNRGTYLDEADRFYQHLASFVHTELGIISHGASDVHVANDKRRHRFWPDYLVFFEQLEQDLQEIDISRRYHECWRHFNSHWHDDWRRRGDVIVWCTR